MVLFRTARASSRGSLARRLLAWLTLFGFALQPGCATQTLRAPETGWQDTLGRVAVISVAQLPDIRFEGFARGKGEGAARGAGSTVAACLGGLGRGGCSGEFCGAAAILVLGICGVATAIGGLAGAAAAPPASAVQQTEHDLAALIQAARVQETLARQVAVSALAQGKSLVTPAPENAARARQTSDYAALVGDGVDTVLEVALTRAGTRGAGINSAVQLYMEARVRLLRVADNRELFSAEYEYQGNGLPLAEWSSGQGKALLDGLATGYVALADHIHDSVFLLFPFPDRSAHAAGMLAAAFGLAPLTPATRGQLSGDRLFGNYFEWTTVDSLHPVLSWQAFPRAADVASQPGLAERIGNIRYDLLVARENNLAPAEIVYRRDGLSGTSHSVQTALRPATRYFWTVRARFELDGRERVTEWATTSYRVLDRLAAPNSFSYRFKTR